MNALPTEQTWKVNGNEVGYVDQSGAFHTVAVVVDPNAASLLAAAPKLLRSLVWMVENDDTNEGDVPMKDHGGLTWNEINEYWIAGLNDARNAIEEATAKLS